MADHEDLPLLSESSAVRGTSYSTSDAGEHVISEEIVEDDSSRRRSATGGATVNCRVCDALIELEGRTNQHVVKCATCHEATPIRPAPAGKKYVRCPCNCLLICKASSTRIACPRANCRRVITLGHREPQGSAVRAPTGSCRVSCVYCHEVFLFNTLNNCLARCPHCKKYSTIGGFARKRSLLFLAATLAMLVASALFTLFTMRIAPTYPYLYVFWFGCYVATLVMGSRFLKFWLVKTSTVIGPI